MKEEYLNNGKMVLIGIVIGVIILAFAGFKFFGWETAGSAQKLAMNQAKELALPMAAQICATNFRKDPKFDEYREVLKTKKDYSRATYFRDTGDWAEVNASLSEYDVSGKCLELLESDLK